MAGIEPLGEVFNVLAVADDVYINFNDCSEISFVCQLTAGDTFTITEATALAGTGAQVLSKVWRTHRGAVAGTGAWATTTPSAASTVVTANSVVAVFTVRANQLSDGYSYIKVASTSTGTVTAILTGLKTRRAPANLPAVSA
jgi:hypothetical protein